MNLGVQYYRPPFPVQKHWADDLKRIRDSGLDTLQVWVTWAWVEHAPGKFTFDDYDRLMDMARDAGLGVLLSTIAELQPHWIHHAVPGSEMIDQRGHRVVSSLREESNFGLTPGGCTEHPEVWARMANFLAQVVTRYRSAPHLVGWDAWNELRWHEQSDGLACFCPHCVGGFREWLDKRHGGLDGLNEAWLRRYSSWDEVAPGKQHWRPFTEMMAWQRFITHKANRHGKRRYDLMKALDPRRPVTVHAGDPSPVTSGWSECYALDRGNDWHYADELDGVGCSNFPKLFGMDGATFTTRVEFVRSASVSGGKKLWLSEVQGGRGSLGFKPTAAVTAAEQQRWIWRGFAGGAEKLLFWCWRDEVFGRETAGFGLAGNDGHAAPRLAALRRTGAVFERHRALLSSYEPEDTPIGVLFSPSSYYLHWALEGDAATPRKALEGYCRALVHLSLPYLVIEEEHLAALESPDTVLRTVFLPRVISASPRLETALATFVRNGGTLVCESECCAYTAEGFYREPAESWLARLGVFPPDSHEAGRRDSPAGGTVAVSLPGEIALNLRVAQWLTPWQNFPADGRVFASHDDGVLVGEVPVGRGRLIHCGSFLGDAYQDDRSPDFTRFVAWCCEGTYRPRVRFADTPTPTPAASPGYIRIGSAQGRPLAVVFLPEGLTRTRLAFSSEAFADGIVKDLLSDRTYRAHSRSDSGEHIIELETGVDGVALLSI